MLSANSNSLLNCRSLRTVARICFSVVTPTDYVQKQTCASVDCSEKPEKSPAKYLDGKQHQVIKMTVTLETLRGDFDRARNKMLRLLYDHTEPAIPFDQFLECWTPWRETHLFDPVLFSKWWTDSNESFRGVPHEIGLQRMSSAAESYLIASSYENEAEGLQEAMAYKLSDGAIDPRKAVQ
jgi:hypothetical protein